MVLAFVTAASASAAAAATKPAHAQPEAAHILNNWKLIAIVAAVLVLVLVDLALVRRSRRTSARRRHEIPRALLFLLAPIYRHDKARDAWVLRLVGKRLGPVLRPRGHRTVAPFAIRDIDYELGLPDSIQARKSNGTPHPLTPPAPSRKRPRRKNRSSENHQPHEPPPLTIRRPPD